MKAIKFEQGGRGEEWKGRKEKKRGKAQTMEGWSDACYPGVWSRVCWISLSLFQSLFRCGFVSGGRLKFNWLHRHRCSCLIPFPGLSCLASFLFLSLHLHLCLSPSLTHRVVLPPYLTSEPTGSHASALTAWLSTLTLITNQDSPTVYTHSTAGVGN